MPLLDHFRPPILNKGSWEGFHGGWPMTMVMDLCKSLPEQYTAEPRVHLGKNFEVDVCTFDVEGIAEFDANSTGAGAATATWAPPEPTLTLELDPTEIYEYEVLIFDQQRGRNWSMRSNWSARRTRTARKLARHLCRSALRCCRRKSAFQLSILSRSSISICTAKSWMSSVRLIPRSPPSHHQPTPSRVAATIWPRGHDLNLGRIPWLLASDCRSCPSG